MTWTGTVCGSARRNAARSSASAGRTSASAGPPTRNQVVGPSGASACTRPRSGGSVSTRCAMVSAAIMPPAPATRRPPPACNSDSSAGRDCAHCVMLPAPRQTTKSPGRAMAWTISARCSGPGQRHHAAMAARAQALHQRVAVDARHRRLAGGIDVGDDHRAGVVHAGAELGEQRLQPRVAVRLHHRDHVARAGLPRRLQHGGDLHRMMAVIVDHGDAAGLAGLGEAPLDAAEAGEGAAQAWRRRSPSRCRPRPRRARSARCAGRASAGGTAPCGASGCGAGPSPSPRTSRRAGRRRCARRAHRPAG